MHIFSDFLFFSCCKEFKFSISCLSPADMAELVDALVSGTSGSNTLEVRVFLRPPKSLWGCSSADRALRSHRRGRGFESHQLHQVFVPHWVALFKEVFGDMAEW